MWLRFFCFEVDARGCVSARSEGDVGRRAGARPPEIAQGAGISQVLICRSKINEARKRATAVHHECVPL